MAESKNNTKKLAIIRVRGNIKLVQGVKDTLKLLRLYSNNFCVVVPNTPTYLGMLNKVKDFVTWGEISDDLFNELVEKRGEEYKGRLTDSKQKYTFNNKFFELNGKKYKKYFRLSPPRGGFERKGIKVPFKLGGVLGYRGDKINDLIKKML